MADALALAKMHGYFVPDLEYTFRAPPVCTERWSAADWTRAVTWHATEIH